MGQLNFIIKAGHEFDESGANVTITPALLNKMLREAYVSAISGTFDLEHITESDLTGKIAATVADDNTTGGLMLLHRIDFAGGSTANYDVTVDYKTRAVLCMFLLKAAGTSEDTLQLFNGSNAITEAVQISNNQKEPVLYDITVTGGSTADYDIEVDDAFTITDAWFRLEAAGTASDTLQVKNGSTAVSDAVDISSGGDHDIIRIGEIDNAQIAFAAGDTLRIAQVDGGSSDCPAARAIVQGYKSGGNDTYLYIAKTYDDANYEIAANGTLRVTQTDGGSSDCPAGTAYIFGIKVA